MGVRDVAGVFSRQFIVGFFLPVFFAGVALDQMSRGAVLPAELRDHPATRLLVLGGIAVLAGLALSALNRALVGVLAGQRLWPAPLRKLRVQRWRTLLQRDPYNTIPDGWEQPTQLGNALVGAGRLVTQRWGLDMLAVWPRVRALLTAEQQQLEADATTDFVFLVNSIFVSAGVALAAAVDLAAFQAWQYQWQGLLGGGLLAIAFYFLAPPAASRFVADTQAALVDVTRLEVYRRAGLRKPTTDVEERELASAFNAAVLRGEAVPDRLRAAVAAEPADVEVTRWSFELRTNAADAEMPANSDLD